MALDCVALLLPSLALLMWIAAVLVKTDAGQAARIAMFLPVAVLAMRHGWRGAAIGGSLASVAIALVMPTLYDPVTMQAEVFMSFALTVLLMLGSRIAMLNAREEKERVDVRFALQAAQQGVFASELRLQQAADTIEQIAASVHQVQGRLLERLRYLLTPTEEQSYSKQAIASRYEAFQLANNLSPRVLQSRGLDAALREGTLAHAFAVANIEYDYEIRGRDVDEIQAAARFAAYRLACEAAAHLFEQAALSKVRLLVRVGVTRGRRWLVVRMDGVHSTDSADELMPSLISCERFKKQVGATGLGVGALRDQAYVFGGTVHLRSMGHGTRLALLLHDANAADAPARVH